MAARFWVGGTGNWDGIDTTHWSATSGGAGGVSAPGASDDVTFDASSGGGTVTVTATQSVLSITGGAHTGTLNTNGQSITVGIFNYAGAGTRSLTLGASTITCTGAGTSWNVSATGGLTLSAASSTITLNGAGAAFNDGGTSGNGNAYGTVNITGSGAAVYACTSGGSGTRIVNFNRTGTAAKTDSLTVYNIGSMTVSGTLTLAGNSATNRLLVQAVTVGTARTLTAAAVSLTNVDFMDITGAGAATWSGTSIGDCGGNTNITFDSPTTQTNTGATGNWSDVTKWTSRVPLPQDAVVINTGSGSVTADMPRLGASIDFTGFTGTWGVTTTPGYVFNIFGSLTLASGMTVSGTQILNFGGRGAQTITSAGKTFGAATFTIDAVGGSYTLQDAFNCTGSTNGLLINSGTFNANNFNVTLALFGTGTGTKTITMGTGTWTFTVQAVTNFWNASGANTTLNGSSSTIVLSTAYTDNRSFLGGGKTYGALTYNVANSPGSITITGSNTFSALNIGPGRQLIETSGTTQTVSTFNANGSPNGYLYLPATASNYVSEPDLVATSVTGDIDLRVKVAMDTWVPAGTSILLSKDEAAKRAYFIGILSSGVVQFGWFQAAAFNSANSTVATGLSAGAVKWVRATLKANDGAGNNQVKFYTSDDGSTWTQLGATVTQAFTTSIDDTTAAVQIGTNFLGANPTAGKFYRAQIRSNILDDGTGIVFDTDFTTKPVGANSVTDTSGNTIAFTGTNLRLPGGSGNFASTPDTAAISITGDIDIRVNTKLDNWGSTAVFASKYGAAGNVSWQFFNLAGTKTFNFDLSQDGTATTRATSSVGNGILNGVPYWVRVTWRASDGRVQFFTSSDATNDPTAPVWVQLGTNQTIALASIFDSTAALEIGSSVLGTNANMVGNVYRVAVYSTIDGTTPIFNADFTTPTIPTRSFKESSTNSAIVTLNGGVTITGTQAQAGDGRVQLNASTPGSAAIMTSTNQQSVNYLTIQDSTVNATPKWYAGINSVNVSGNTNWLFVAPPSSGGGGEGGTGTISAMNLLNLRSL